MNTTVTAPEVQEFLTAVRVRLADLDPDEQREILDGLEADLTDLVAERGRGALGDPVDYARELRTAAGLDPQMGNVRRGMSLSEAVHSFLDDAHRQYDRLSAALPGDGAAVLAALQPAWWVLRAWLAVEVAAYFFGAWDLQVIPGSNVPGAIAVLAAVVLSVQVGRGRLWPGNRWRTAVGLRLLLLGLNVFAILMVPSVSGALDHHDERYGRSYELGYQDGTRSIRDADAKAGLTLDGRRVTNLYPYDAEGQPLVGVQLFDQSGKPIPVTGQPERNDDIDHPDEGRPRVYYPWTNGSAQLFNVFPVPSRLQDGEDRSPTAFTEEQPPAITPYPFGQVPGVSLPGIATGRQSVPVAPASTPSP